jgi:hypothetical protein
MARNVKQLAGLGQAESAPSALFARWRQSSAIQPYLTLPLAVGQLRRPPTKLQKGKLFDECQIEVVRS